MELLSKSEIAREKNENATHVCCVRLSIYGPQNKKKRLSYKKYFMDTD